MRLSLILPKCLAKRGIRPKLKRYFIVFPLCPFLMTLIMAGRNRKSWKRQCAAWRRWTGLFPGWCTGRSKHKPDDEQLRSLDRGDLRRFLQTAPSSFEDAEFPVQRGITDQFPVRLEELRKCVDALG